MAFSKLLPSKSAYEVLLKPTNKLKDPMPDLSLINCGQIHSWFKLAHLH